MSWWEYVREITHGDNAVEISRRVDRYIQDHPDEPLERVAHQTIGRWSRNRSAIPSSPGVRAIARTYGANVREAYIAAGILTEEDLEDQPEQSRDPLDRMMTGLWARLDTAQKQTVVELLKELSRRNNS